MTRGDEEIIDDALDMLVWQRHERERLEAEVTALTAENERLRARITKDIEVELSMCAIANEEASGEWIDGFDFAWKRVRAALGDTQ